MYIIPFTFYFALTLVGSGETWAEGFGGALSCAFRIGEGVVGKFCKIPGTTIELLGIRGLLLRLIPS